MITDIPASLPKQIASYVRKSNELENVDPIMSYFCKLYAIEEILDSGMHTSDESIAVLAGELLDSVEAQKKEEDEEKSVSEIVGDKDVSISYVLNFSDGIFNNSLRQITERRSSKATAFNLLTSVTFYDVLKLWFDYEGFGSIVEMEELNKRKKYAKFHAARILKSLKNGEDPNEYVVPVEKKSEEETAEEEEEYPIMEPDGSNSDGLGLPNVKPTIIQSRSPSLEANSKAETAENKAGEEDQEDDTNVDISKILPNPPSSHPKHEESKNIDNDLGLPSAPQPHTHPSLPKIPTVKPSAPSLPTPPTSLPSKPTVPFISRTPSPSPAHKEEAINVEEIIEVNEIYSKAQKHAKFAISAMNYEDKETSIKELEKAIELLNKLR